MPPPIVSSASSTVTSTPARASATAQASPLGPEPTTVAVLTRRAAGSAGSTRRSTSTGNSNDSSSHGWRSTMSATATDPSSTSPVAAS